MRPDGSKVGGTNGFLQLPHSYPSSASQVAANNREIERVVNQIPIGSTSTFAGQGDDAAQLNDGTSTVEFDFTLPGTSATFYAVFGRVRVDLTSSDPDLISVWGFLDDFTPQQGYTGPHKARPSASVLTFPLAPVLHIGGGTATIAVTWDGNSSGDLGNVEAVIWLTETSYQP